MMTTLVPKEGSQGRDMVVTKEHLKRRPFGTETVSCASTTYCRLSQGNGPAPLRIKLVKLLCRCDLAIKEAVLSRIKA